MENEVKFKVEEFVPEEAVATSADLTPMGYGYPNYESYNWGYSSEAGSNSNVTFQDIDGYYQNLTNRYSLENFDTSYFSNGGTTVSTTNYSNYNSYSSHTTSQRFNIGNRSEILRGYSSDRAVLNFTDVNISSFVRQNNYMNFNMANGTSFQAQTSYSADDIFKYTTDGRNISYAKLGMTNSDNTFQYVDDVTFIGSSSHKDTLNLSTYTQSVDLNGNQYIDIDNIDARSSQSHYYQRNLIGNTGSNKIYAGANDQLWGGKGGNDELYGSGSGNNTFYFGANEGSTTIYDSTERDHVDLYNVSLSQISSAYESGSDFVINMYNGDSLKIVGQDGASNFRLADNSEYSYHRDTHTWQQTK